MCVCVVVTPEIHIIDLVYYARIVYTCINTHVVYKLVTLGLSRARAYA